MGLLNDMDHTVEGLRRRAVIKKAEEKGRKEGAKAKEAELKKKAAESDSIL